ncbi:hypothetical protein C8F01DRAFT_1103141 [Mycena amicta]|nr:hypothetical protein C8F01DRAFT_1103141 [Mycena amicta]
MSLFAPARVHIPDTLVPPSRRIELSHTIERNGGKIVQLTAATHVVTNTLHFTDARDAPDNVHIVTGLWVDRCMILGELLPPDNYSVEPGKIFSGVVATATGISASDVAVLETGITSLGGVWRTGLTREVTHLFATSPGSEKYIVALEHQAKTGMKILLPHWFDDAMRIGSGLLSTTSYEWPNPQLLKPLPTSEKPERKTFKMSVEKQQYFKTAVWDPQHQQQFPASTQPTGDDIWSGRRILLSRTLELDDERRQAVEQAVQTAGGRIVRVSVPRNGDFDRAEYEKIQDCDVYITRWRAGRAFLRVQINLSGTLNWLFFVHATQTVSSPMDQLLHYPVRRILVAEDFAKQQITVTNYTGEIREYLKSLIRTMGANFTPNMTGTNTILIAAHMGGIKTTKALAWSIPVVNHVWLEDCFSQWRFINPAVPKYIEFPPHVDFTPMLAERGLHYTLDDLYAEEEQDIRRRDGERAPIGTEASAKELYSQVERKPLLRRSKTSDEIRLVPASVSPTKAPGDRFEGTMPLRQSKKRPPQNPPQSPEYKQRRTNGKAPTLFSDNEGSSAEKPKRAATIQHNKPTSPKRKANSMVEPGETSSESPPPKKRAKTATTSQSASNGHPKTSPTESAKVLADHRPTVAARIAAIKRQKRVEPQEDDDQRTRSSKPDNSDQSAEPKVTKGKARAKTGNISSGSRRSTSNVRIMTTIVDLPEGVFKKLSKLGVKQAATVAECTHLIAAGVVRTEKFLCAWILSPEWASKSAAANRLLSEEDYILSDKVNEEKWGFKLKDAMKRAKMVDGKLFEGMTFYATPKIYVTTARNLLKAVVEAQGGKLGTQTPTIRIVNSAPHRHVVSCNEDVAVWKHLAAHTKIYSQELLLLSTLAQRIDWEDPQFYDEDSEDSESS